MKRDLAILGITAAVGAIVALAVSGLFGGHRGTVRVRATVVTVTAPAATETVTVETTATAQAPAATTPSPPSYPARLDVPTAVATIRKGAKPGDKIDGCSRRSARIVRCAQTSKDNGTWCTLFVAVKQPSFQRRLQIRFEDTFCWSRSDKSDLTKIPASSADWSTIRK
jgi:hypothetical protein